MIGIHVIIVFHIYSCRHAGAPDLCYHAILPIIIRLDILLDEGYAWAAKAMKTHFTDLGISLYSPKGVKEIIHQLTNTENIMGG